MEKSKKEENYEITIDQKHYKVKDRFITGSQIKSLAGVPSTYGVWLKVKGPHNDKEIMDDEKVDLKEHGAEHFFTGSKTTTAG